MSTRYTELQQFLGLTLYYLGTEGLVITLQRVLRGKAMCPLLETSANGGRMIC